MWGACVRFLDLCVQFWTKMQSLENVCDLLKQLFGLFDTETHAVASRLKMHDAIRVSKRGISLNVIHEPEELRGISNENPRLMFVYSLWLRLHWQKKSDLLPISDTNQNLMHACNTKDPIFFISDLSRFQMWF